MTFATDVAKFTIKTDGLQKQKVQYLCLSLLRGIVLGTPVDTGRARGNWQASIGAPINSDVTTTDKVGGATISKAMPQVAEAPGKVFFITNNLPYIYGLEFEGRSKQATSGWIRSNIERTKAIAARL